MKLQSYLLIIIISTSIFSCSQNDPIEQYDQNTIELTKNEVLSISYYDSKELSEKDVFTIVNTFIDSQSDNPTRSIASSLRMGKKTYINKQGEFNDEKLITRSGDDDDVTSTICEVEFNSSTGKGLAVVATDGKLPSVLAFIPNLGDERSTELSGVNELIHASKASYLYKSIKTKELVDSLMVPTLEKISQRLNLPIQEITYERIKDNIILIDDDISTRVGALQRHPPGIQKLKSSIAPLVKTNWGQNSPYNGYFYTDQNLFKLCVTSNNGRGWEYVPAGCVNIAMAQMMTHTHLRKNPLLEFTIPNSNVKYNPQFYYMAEKPTLEGVSSTGYFHAQYLILNLYYENDTQDETDYSGAVTGSGVSDEAMLKTMTKYFRFDAKTYFNGDRAWEALRNENLVFMLTSYHAFIISGILITEMANPTRVLVKTNDVYWHANLGWGDENTGYYQLDTNARVYFDPISEWCYKLECFNNVRAK